MNNSYAMSLTLSEKKHRTDAMIITGGVAILVILLMLFWKWDLPLVEKEVPDLGIEVMLQLPDEPEIPSDGGGGGGNPVQAAGAPGIAKYVPPTPGDKDPSQNVDEVEDKQAVAITKPVITKPEAKKITNSSVAKTEPKPIIETPAPRVPKNVLGKTTTGTGKGGGAADDYDRPGGKGNGSGVGNGNGTGGGTGNGNGGGNGTGTGGGTGPKVTRGDRKIVRYYSFEGDLDKAVIYANVNVSPEGIGKFVSIAKGSSNSSNAYKEAIIQYLQNIKFDKADHESMLTVQFNFRVN